MTHKRNCPICNKELFYSTEKILKVSIKENRVCKSCSNKTMRHSNYGKPLSQQLKDKIRKGHIGFKHNQDTKLKMADSQRKRYSNLNERTKMSELVKTAMHTPSIRKRHLDALYQSKWLKVRTDKGQIELLEKWNRLGFQFEPNFQVHAEGFLAYVDGYDAIHNIVIEYDTKYHTKSMQKQKDIYRQHKIIDILNPKKFWRYNSETKTIVNILGGQSDV